MPAARSFRNTGSVPNRRRDVQSGDPHSDRRSVVPAAAGRSLWLAAVWTGVGAALVGTVVAVVSVAVLWLPAAGGSGTAGSVLRAGAITFVASLHGGVTVDGIDAAFLPLGLLIITALIVRRAGRGLADAAADLGETDTRRLAVAGCVQAFAFAVAVAVLASVAPLGTSSASAPGAFLAGVIVFLLAGWTSLARASSLGESVARTIPALCGPALRIGAAVLGVYVASGALLVAGSLVVHHRAVEQLSAQVGGGWATLPVLLLCALAAPNAAVAGGSYLIGPGFALGTGTTVRLDSSPVGRLPAFPLLGAVPSGPALSVVWLLAALTAIGAGAVAARIASRTDTRWQALAGGAGAAGLLGVLLAWQAGGRIGSARLNAIGASPWQFGGAVLLLTGCVGTVLLAAAALVRLLRKQGRVEEPAGRLGALVATIGATVEAAATEIETAIGSEHSGTEHSGTEHSGTEHSGTEHSGTTRSDTTPGGDERERRRGDQLAG